MPPPKSPSAAHGGDDRHALRLPGGTAAPSAARRVVGGLLGQRLPRAHVHDALLLLTELVANAVVHGGCRTAEDPVRINVELTEDWTRLEVCDSGPGFEPHGAPTRRAGGGGMGLMLVDRVSAEWGVRQEDGACVWFELAA